MEHRAIQRAKLQPIGRRPLEGQVVVITGGAGAIGAAVAGVCAEAGAHVVVTDLDESRLAGVVKRVEARCGAGTALGVVMDVTDEAGVQSGFAEVVRTYGGVDVIVPNAGIAHVAPIEDLAVDDFRRVMEVNAVGYLLAMREGIKILKRQGLGGHIVMNASKNVFSPGKDFGAYSASKAAGHQLGKVAAIELAPYGIRVNMINADAIFGDQETPSGLWAAVGPERAKSRDLKQQDLPEYYRKRNLLRARVCGRHVGNAVVFFASNATPTTGATLPVDGGLVEAFPR
ncbi:MAG: SDR family NAD(P)-dependent oxidoreductase [Phycisphaerae bacterium]